MGALVGHIAFGPFRMDVEAGRLLRDGVDLDLRPQAFQALRTLIQHPGRQVDYEQMIHEAWSGAVVSRHTVAVTIGEAKKVLREYGGWIQYRPKQGYRLEIPVTEDLIKRGRHFAARYTRDGFDKALEYFEAAAQADEADFRAFQGMTECYLLLGAYGMRSPREMYSRFLQAYERTVLCGGLTPALRADKAHAAHVFERRFADAEQDLVQAAKEAPQEIPILGYLVMLHATMGRFDEALETLKRAYSLDSLWPMLSATETLVRFFQRDFPGAVESGRKTVDLHPYLTLGHFFLAQALAHSGELAAAIEQFRLAYGIAPDLHWLRAYEASCQARIGNRREAERIVGELEERRQTDYVGAYCMAGAFFALGCENRGFQELELALEENSAPLFVMNVDPDMDPLRGNPRFERIREKVFGIEAKVQAGWA